MSLSDYDQFLERAFKRPFTRQLLNEFISKRISFFEDWVSKILPDQQEDFFYSPYDIPDHEAAHTLQNFRKLAGYFMGLLKTEPEQTDLRSVDCLHEKMGYLIELGYEKRDYNRLYTRFSFGLADTLWTKLLDGLKGPYFGIESLAKLVQVPEACAAILSRENRFVVSDLTLKIYDPQGYHANTLIFDKKTMRVYQFEPHGENYDPVDPTLFFPFTLVRTNEIIKNCPVQCLEGEGSTSKLDPGGYCFFWSIMYAYLFITCTAGSLENRIEELERAFYAIRAQQGRKNLFRRMVRGMANVLFSDNNTCSRRPKALCEFDRNCEWVSNWKGRIGQCQLRRTRFLKNVVQLSIFKYKYEDIELVFKIFHKEAKIRFPKWRLISNKTKARQLLCHLLQISLDSGKLLPKSTVTTADLLPLVEERHFFSYNTGLGFKLKEKLVRDTDIYLAFEATIEELLAKCV